MNKVLKTENMKESGVHSPVTEGFMNSFGLCYFVLQDTLIAMEALYQFTQVDPNRNVFDLNVHLESTASPSWVRDYYLTKDDYTRLYVDSVSFFLAFLNYLLYLLHFVTELICFT